MDKFIKILAEQNPYTTPDCPNCNHQMKIKTEDFFGSGKDYETTCPYCNQTITFTGVKEQIDKLKKQFKSIGITW